LRCPITGSIAAALLRKNFRRRAAAIEPVIGHLKSDYRLKKNFLKVIKA